ncbi:Putative transposase [Caballeronia arationis]|nr:Putative transposase [Caballeronia arationis]
MHHPHLHCVVPGGGLSLDSARWVACRPGFFLPVRVLSRLFRRLFLERLRDAYDAGALQFFFSLAPLSDRSEFARYLSHPRTIDWVVYAKEPFGGPQQVLDYLGRYTHRVAISNKLPLGLQRIRHYGLLSNRLRASRLAECRRLLHAPPAAQAATKSQAGYRERYEVLTSRSLYRCPVCAQGHMVCVECLSAGALPRAPPLGPA